MPRVARFLLACVALVAAAPRAQADPVRVEDLVLLLDGGVPEEAIRRHLERWGLERDLRAADLVALRRAGASGDLLTALAETRGGEGAEERTLPLPDGRGVLLTNLDEEGRRIGGDTSEPVPANLLEPAPREAGRDRERERASGRPEAPEPPAAEPVELFEEPAPRRAGLWGTPGGYTRYKLHYSRAPEEGFRTWVFPVLWVIRAPVVIAPAWGSLQPAPPLVVY